MSPKYRRRAIDKIPYPIGVKLITIISIILIISLGSITALVSWLVSADLRVTAEENNFEMNRRSAKEAEDLLSNMRSNSRILIQTITALGTQTSSVKESIDFFFVENPQIAAIFFIAPGKQEQFLVNEPFFTSRQIDEELVVSYFYSQRPAMGRAVNGETVLLNVAPHFSRSMLAMFFPWQNGGVGGVLFSSESLNNNFGFGLNKSYMVNIDGDVVSHADFSIVKEGVNISHLEYIRAIFLSPQRNRQMLLESDFGVMKTFSGSGTGGFFPAISPEVRQNIREKTRPYVEPVIDALFEYVIEPIIDSAFDYVIEPVLENILEYVIEPAFEYVIEPYILPVIDRSKDFLSDRGLPTIELNKKQEKKTRQFVAYTKLNTAGAIVITTIEYDKIFEGIAATTRRNIYLTIAVLCISIIFIWFFSKTISVPLRSLAQVARQIESGKFEIELYSKNRDEIGILTSSFQKMCSALHIFGRFTNKEIAVKAMRGEIKPGGLPKHGTVFFSDIREFTAKSESFTKYFGAEASDKIVFWLNAYFTQMVDCVEKTNGVVDKFIGDAVMAHWGTAYSAGSPRKDAFNCVKAALMMRKALYFMNRERKPGDPANPLIRIGCGINSGVVTAGQLGSDMRMEYTVIGDPVNLASRIEALTKPLGADILISEDTWKLVGDLFVTEEMPSVTVKGKERPVRIFAVVNFVGEQKGPQNLGEVRELLGLEAPNIEKVDVNSDEKKYKIGEGQA